MRGAPPPEPPRGGRSGQSGRFPVRPDGSQRLGQRASGGSAGAPPGGASLGRLPAPGAGRTAAGNRTPGGYAPSGPRRAYGSPSGVRQPVGPSGPATGYGPGAYPSAELTAATMARPRLRTAMLHFGNPGHLWRGEFNSMLGEAVISVGVVMWLALATYSPKDIALALVALGLPALIAGPLAAPLTRVQEPAGLFKLFGRLRVLFALGLIGMHFLTILPVMYLLLFGISLCGRLRATLRVAAMRACLATGEPERVAASTHFAAVVVAVAGPLLASILYLLDGERLLFVSVGGAVFFLLSTSSDALVRALPRSRRAFLLAKPEPDVYDSKREVASEEIGADDDPNADDDTAQAAGRLESALPEWQQWGPGKFGEAVADISAGLGLASSTARGASALRTLAAIALVGGGISIIEVFYITDHLL
ncbi:MAG TPA: hypothetical protein VGN32_21455, partial [Ktedonobacterales bacterium]|nr:hypothetical protein [Ktedonobacterales bacterium]